MIIRRRHTRNYTTIGNVLFDDERLAADEVGILAFLLSRPNDWEVRRPALMRRWGIGITAMKRIVNNWMRTGWCHAEKVRLPNGQFFIVYEIRDEPGRELSDDEIREALSLVSSEAADETSQGQVEGENHPPVTGTPPPCDPPLADHPLADGGVAYKENTNNGLPRDESDQKNEREYARAKEKHATNLAEFKRRYPTTASDDQGRIDRAWFALAFEEGEAALAGIPAFLEKLKRDKRTTVPAAYTYLEQKRWTLLDPRAASSPAGPSTYAPDSTEARAIRALHDLAGRLSAFFKIFRRADGSVSYVKPLTEQLLALAQAPDRATWPTLTRQQAAAWEHLLREVFDQGLVRTHLREGSQAPWPWPPRKDGTLSTAPPPDNLMSEQDFQDFKT